MKHSERFLSIVEEVRASVAETDVSTVHARRAGGEALLLVDVREESEWAAGHIPGALHIGKGVIERDIEGKIPDLDREIILYCGGGFRSILAAETLGRMGYTRVVSMDGGMRGWREAGLEETKG